MPHLLERFDTKGRTFSHCAATAAGSLLPLLLLTLLPSTSDSSTTVTCFFLLPAAFELGVVAGLLFSASNSAHVPETKAGVPRYRGGPSGFEEWKFKVLGKVSAIKAGYVDEDDHGLRDRKLIELSSWSVWHRFLH